MADDNNPFGNGGPEDFFRMLEQILKSQLGEQFNDAAAPADDQPAAKPEGTPSKPKVTRTVGNGRYFEV